MGQSNKLDLNNPPPILDEEDDETIAAIEEGIRDAEAGRMVPLEEVRKNYLSGLPPLLHGQIARRSV